MVKCADCGFLTMRNTFTGQLEEVDGDFRKTGNPPQRKETVVGGPSNRVAEVTKTPYRHVPICFALAYLLAEEILASEDVRSKYPDLPAPMVLEVITKERPCATHTEWKQGFTPREHREMLDRQHRQAFENELRKQAWEREDRRDEAMRRREDERDSRLESLQTRLHRQELIIIGVGVTIALVLGSIAAAIIEGAISAGWISEPSWWPF